MGSRSEPYEAPAIRAFASELTAWRSAAGLNKTEFAEALGYTPQWISQVEAAKSIPSKEFAENLDTFFKTNGVFVRQWERIIDTRHQAILPPGFAEYLELETEASQLRGFDLTLVRGPLQTEGYMRSILSHNRDPETGAQLVSERLARREILTRKDPPSAWFTLDESVLRREVAGRDIMHEQLAHILTLGERSNIEIDVVPQRPEYYPGYIGSFILLSFPKAPDVAYTEAAGQEMLIQDPGAVARFAVLYNSVRGHALPLGESRALIESIMEGYR
ncbi:helix-turn-helix domain-containing protein [Actinomadura rubrisoli]|uniref:XRE family transcriptional regulator n=1 Tax=Actinomadura rubrisoli TaxID=2530368 RepID=A0A4R5BNS2_9ACTN|nr:helix-turn-helix transcriptional regulator [Actinomadura rubrisoli]TDD87529.1 XRE family transcriptional regulator [Actinomadura rubrisoli]